MLLLHTDEIDERRMLKLLISVSERILEHSEEKYAKILLPRHGISIYIYDKSAASSQYKFIFFRSYPRDTTFWNRLRRGRNLWKYPQLH